MRRLSQDAFGPGLLVAMLVIGASAVTAQMSNDEPPEEAPLRLEEADSRYRAALASREEELARISRAAITLNQLPESLEERRLMVSFSKPESLERVLEGIGRTEGVRLQVVFIWMQAPGSLYPIVGEHSVEALQWPVLSPAASADVLTDLAVEYLTHKEEELRSSSPEIDTALAEQLEETVTVRTRVESRGPEVFGLLCTCLPSSIDAFSEISAVKVRAIELFAEGEPQFPIWPQDPLRDRVIETRGKYGH